MEQHAGIDVSLKLSSVCIVESKWNVSLRLYVIKPADRADRVDVQGDQREPVDRLARKVTTKDAPLVARHGDYGRVSDVSRNCWGTQICARRAPEDAMRIRHLYLPGGSCCRTLVDYRSAWPIRFCQACEQAVVQAPAPKGVAADRGRGGLCAGRQYACHLPLYRQAQMLGAQGLDNRTSNDDDKENAWHPHRKTAVVW
jgi:hypothetical protein